MIDEIKNEMFKSRSNVVIIPIERLRDIRNDVVNLQNSEFCNNAIKGIIKDFYRFDLPDVPFTIRSIIIVVTPRALARVNFKWGDKTISVLHEADVNGFEKTEYIKRYLNEFLNSRGYHVINAELLPQKLLAVRSGLAKYGRNNITYVEGMGSLHIPITYYSDIPSSESNWYDIRQMDCCKDCKVCLNNCPTGAITKERYLIQTERCLTYLNEFIEPIEFPGWLKKSAHNCIRGCMKCQINCPKNKEFHGNIAGLIEFSEEETLLLMRGRPFNELPVELAYKIERLSLTDFLDYLPRNLRALLGHKEIS